MVPLAKDQTNYILKDSRWFQLNSSDYGWHTGKNPIAKSI